MVVKKESKVNISIYYDQPHRKPIINQKQTITNKRIEQVARCKLTYKNQQCFSISAIILEIKAENSNKTNVLVTKQKCPRLLAMKIKLN